MRTAIFCSILFLVLACTSSPQQAANTGNAVTGLNVGAWVTNADKSKLFSEATAIPFSLDAGQPVFINVDTTLHYQTMDGFGYALTGGSAQLINQKLSAADRTNLLRELFLTDQNGIGISYLRISIGASDLDDHVFSYDDLPAGQTDLPLSKFSLDPDRANLIPVLKEILALNPQIKIMGSPWSAPTWMKSNSLAKDGSLKPECYSSYANYFVKYVQEMAKEGIPIDAVTLQNEPENPGNTPSMVMTSANQIDFVKTYLGPAFKAAGITTKIVVFDHNCDHPNYPIAVLDDPQAYSYIDGSAFHMYLGDISAMSQVHAAHPDKNVYFTEQWTSGKGDFAGDLVWHVKNLIIGAPRNWSRNVLEWNLAADENFNPHTNDGGCTLCQGALTINSTTGAVTRNVSYYIIAHASKFIRPGSMRVNTQVSENLFNVAFVNPDGKKVLVVVNDNNAAKTFSIRYKGMTATTSLQAGAVGTYVW